MIVNGPFFNPAGLSTGIQAAMRVVESMVLEQKIDGKWTSGTDRKHGRGSLHYSGNAVDFVLDISDEEYRVFKKDLNLYVNGPWSWKVPNIYDVVFEGDHIHMEYQPKIPHEERIDLIRKEM